MRGLGESTGSVGLSRGLLCFVCSFLDFRTPFRNVPKNSNAKDDGASEQIKFGEVLISYAHKLFFFLSEHNLNSSKTGDNL